MSNLLILDLLDLLNVCNLDDAKTHRVQYLYIDNESTMLYEKITLTPKAL